MWVTSEMKSSSKHPVSFLKSVLVYVLISLAIVSGTVSFICYKLGSSLLHKRNMERIEVLLDPKEFHYEEVEFKSQKDNTTLKGVFFFSNPPGNKTIIIVHGYNQNRMLGGSTNIIAEYFIPLGYNILAFDLRGGGRSGGNLITFGYYEKYDVMGAIDYLKQRGKEGEKIVLLGFSMGAVTAIETAGKDIRVDAVIADSPFRDLKLFFTKDLAGLSNDLSAVSDNLGHIPYLQILRYMPFKYKIAYITTRLCGIEINKVSPMNTAKHLSQKPIFLIHGKNDRIIPYANSEEIFQSIKNNPYAELWLTEKAGHLESLDMYTDEYLKNIRTFLDKCVF